MIDTYFDGGVVTKNNCRVLIVNAYENELSVAWTLEYSNYVIKYFPNTYQVIFDIGKNSFCLDQSFLAYVKQKINRTNLISVNLIKLYCGEKKIKFHIAKKNYKIVFSAIHLTKEVIRNKYENKNQLLETFSKALHSSLSNKFNSIFYSKQFHLFAVLKRAMTFLYSYQSTIDFLSNNEIDQVVVGNGRWPNSAGVALAAKHKHKKILFLERGGTPGMFNTFAVSPHSMSERHAACEKLWNMIPLNKKYLAINIAKSYLDLRFVYDPSIDNNWSNHKKSEILFNQNKKICVYFPSTELEVAVFGDEVKPGEFKSQIEAVKALVAVLDGAQWDIYIRRHPGRHYVLFDPEKELWKEFYKIPNVKIIESNSEINSYELAKKADVVCHYNSSMGPQSIYLGAKRVITLGETIWEDRNSKFSPRTKQQIINSLQMVEDPEDRMQQAYKWAFYSAVAGAKFKIFSWKNGKLYLEECQVYTRAFSKRMKLQID